jgi:SAM-dependent methyltransferase
VRFLKSKVGYALYHRWMARKGHPIRTAESYIRKHAPGGTFLDVGGMWTIHGAHSFLAEEAGSRRVVCLDLNQTPEFLEQKRVRGSAVEFVQGDATDRRALSEVGVNDVVWCFGVLYHVPDPFALLRSLRRVCGGKLFLETLTIPEVGGAPHAGVYFPMLPPNLRQLWDTRRRGSARVQYGISTEYEHRHGYGNNFWGLSPSAISALLMTSGFRVDEVAPSPQGVFRHVFTCSPIPWEDPFA